MNRGSINIKVTASGGATFGNIQQGDHNIAQSGSLSVEQNSDKAFVEAFAELDRIPLQQEGKRCEVEALRAELVELQAAVKAGKSTRWGSIAATAKVLFERYGWALDLLKKLYAAIPSGLL